MKKISEIELDNSYIGKVAKIIVTSIKYGAQKLPFAPFDGQETEFFERP